MSILDDAIRQHLELKRAHGADDSELKRLEDEAFGPPQRPDEIDPFAEPPTEFLVTSSETPAAAPEVEDDAMRSGRRPDIADLQEAPPAAEELAPVPDAPPPSPADAADAPLPPPVEELPPPADAGQAMPSEEIADASAAEASARISDDAPDASAGPIADSGPDTEERHAIADQPTQMFDVQSHVDAEAVEGSGAPEENVAPFGSGTEASAPTDDAEPEQEPLAMRGPDAEVAGHSPSEATPTEEESAEYDFFNEQRLSDELDQALEAPLPPTDEHIAMPRYGDVPPEQESIFDFENEPRYEEDPSEEALRRHDAPEPPTEEAARAAAEPDSEEADAFDPDTGHEDVLEDTPTFLEDAPEDDDLWFEQKPPKDFDL